MRALISGLSGMDGSLLAEFLLATGIDVYGLVRRSSERKLERLQHILHRVVIVPGDLTDQTSLDEAVRKVQPDYIFNLGAHSFVAESWGQPEVVANVTGLGALRMLEAMRKFAPPHARFYQAGSSEQFGKVQHVPQQESTPFYPRSPYGVAKTFAFQMTRCYRESYGLFACSGLLFNHEGSTRGKEFVTRKITSAVARIKLGKQEKLELGNLDAQRDWSHAKDMVRGMWMMLNHSEPDDFVLASGKTHSIREFLELAFSYVGLHWQDYVVINSAFIRPAEVDILLGDYTKAKTILGWEPTIAFPDLVAEMIEYDLACETEGKEAEGR